jgi:hypothetical protein
VTTRLAPCGSSGPHLEATIVTAVPGKPPGGTFFVDLRVYNPLDHTVWMFFDAREIPTTVTRVWVERTASQPAAIVWSLQGATLANAMPLPAHADIMLRGLELYSSSRAARLVLSFADDVLVHQQPAMSWFGRDELTDRQGEFVMRGSRVWIAEKKASEPEELALTLHGLCQHEIDVSGWL